MHCFAKCECLQIKWKYRSYCQNAQFAYNKIIFYYSLPSRINFIFFCFPVATVATLKKIVLDIATLF